jgi:CRISPR-associated protein Cst2
MSNRTKGMVYEIALLARTTWNLHSLNNEGTVGNVVEPRTVVLADGSKSDGVSGEMLKHIHAENVWIVESDKSKFCSSCIALEPMRADRVTEVITAKSAEKATDIALKGCAICDLHGFLVQRPTVARASTVEFGWAVGLRDGWHRETHVHARHAPGEKGKQKEEGKATSQMVYHRPTRSGVYAVASVFQPWRIGLNGVNLSYVKKVDRTGRYRLALEAYCAMFLRTEGAMTSCRLPHTEGLEGCLVVSRNNLPAPVVSPLRDDYISELSAISEQFNALEVKTFSSVAEYVGIINELIQEQPYTI